MTRYWIAACDRVGALSLRERLILFAAGAVVLVAAMDNLLLSPLLEKQKALSVQIVQQQERMKAQQAQMQAVLQASSESDRSPLRQRLDELKRELEAQSEALRAAGEGMVEPSKMTGLLEQVLKQNESVQLLELKTLPPSPVDDAAADKAGKADANPVAPKAYRHGVQVAVRGRYLDLMRYVAVLEKLPVRMAWGEASLDVERYPDAVLKLTLYTYSMEKTWLSI